MAALADPVPMSRAPARLRGPVAVAVYLVLAAAAVTAGWVAISDRPRPTGLVELRAIDAEYAVLVRDVAQDPDRSFLSLFHIDRGEVWGALVPRVAKWSREHSAIVATAGVVAVYVRAGERIDLMAFDAARGEKLGRITVVEPAMDGAVLAHAGNVVDSGAVFDLVLQAGDTVAMAIDLRQGLIRWRTTLGQGRPAHAWLRGQHLLVYVQDRLHILDQATGRPASGTEGGIALDPTPCVLDDRAYGFRDGVLHAVLLSGGPGGGPDGHARPLPVESQHSPHMLLGICGHHGNRDVLVTLQSNRDRVHTGTLIAVDRDTGTAAWTMALAHPLTLSQLSGWTGPRTASLSGALPRYAPILLSHEDTGILAMLDLERGEIAWQSRPAFELLDATLVRIPGQRDTWLGAGRFLAVLDGNTGALGAAVASNGRPFSWPWHIASGRLWIRSYDAWGVLDAGSLALVPGVGTLTVQADVRQLLIERLGVPGTW